MNDADSFSLRKGFSFTFKDGDNVIESWFSSISGKEEVRLNGQVVARQRTLSYHSSNQFDVEGVHYKSELEVKHLFKGPFVCTLFKNGEPYKRKKLIFPALNKYVPWHATWWFYLTLGAIAGLVVGLLDLSFWFAIAVISLLFLFNSIKAPQLKPYIEEVELDKPSQISS